MRPRYRCVIASAVTWLVGTACAITVGLGALTVVGVDSFDPAGPPLGLYLTPQGSPYARGTSPPLADGDESLNLGEQRVFVTTGGTIQAGCTPDAAAFLVYWSPRPGNEIAEIHRGPRHVATITFSADSALNLVNVTCVNGVPQASYRTTGYSGINE